MTTEKIKIENRLIGEGEPCFIIAEAGVNHNGDLELAKRMVDAAKEAGADAVKFQTFRAEEIATPQARQAEYQTKNIGKEESQYEMLKKLELPYSSFRELKDYCANKQIIFLSTPHSCKEDVDLVAELCPCIKVASADLTNLPILKYIAQKSLPVMLSTGMSTLDEVKEAAGAVLPFNKKLILFHCTANYPTPLNEVNLRAILTMGKAFGLPTGYSDHTEGIGASLASVSLGVCVVEKHFTLDKNLPGPDHKASLEPRELKNLVDGIRDIEERLSRNVKREDIIKELKMEAALGNGIKKPQKSELDAAKVARKSIVAAVEIEKGEIIKENMLAIKRPGTGIKPKHFDGIVGRTAKNAIKKDSLIKFSDLK